MGGGGRAIPMREDETVMHGHPGFVGAGGTAGVKLGRGMTMRDAAKVRAH